jgi:tetratricopeptide (TPR) repeat protein
MLPVYYNLRAAAYEKKDQLTEARADLDMAVKLRPDFTTWFNRGVFLSDHGLDSAAIADFDLAITAYEKRAPAEKAWEEFYVQANYRRAEILRHNDRVADSLPNYDKAIALRPDNVEMLFSRALAHSRLEHFDAVIADLGRVIDSPRRGPFLVSALNNRGLAYMRQGNFREALADLDRALSTEPGSSLSLVRRGLIHERAGQRDKALADYREALKITPTLKEARDGLQRLNAAP